MKLRLQKAIHLADSVNLSPNIRTMYNKGFQYFYLNDVPYKIGDIVEFNHHFTSVYHPEFKNHKFQIQQFLHAQDKASVRGWTQQDHILASVRDIDTDYVMSTCLSWLKLKTRQLI